MRRLRYLSLFSGVEAATLAWEPMGWEPVAFAEVDPFPASVLAHRWPGVPNLGDVTKVDWSGFVERYGRPDVLAGGSPCFPAGTLVLTDKKLVPIEDVKVGDLVLTHKGRYRRVLSTGSRIASTVVLKGQGTSGIESTPNHPFYSCKKEYTWNNARRGRDLHLSDATWTDAADMKGKMWLNVNAALVPKEVPSLRMRGRASDYEFDEPFFYFIGRWLGDGWTVAHKRKHRKNSVMKRVYVCCAHELADDLQARLQETGLTFTRSEDRTVTKFVCSSTPLFDWINENFGKGASGKQLPAWVFGMPEELREALFLGYIDSDGTPIQNATRTCSISKSLTVGMKILASGIGYTSSVVYVENSRRECSIEGRIVNEHPYYNQTYRLKSNSAVLCDEGFWGLVRKILPGRSNVTVYNLEVECDNSYTADGIAVHNCQSFSVAGGRKSLDGESRLMFEYIRAVGDVRPRWIIWENVPGCLNTRDNAFGQLLGELEHVGYQDLSWRVLDSQFVRFPLYSDSGELVGFVGPVAQRRRRVFLVGRLGVGWRSAAVLLEPGSLRGDNPSSREKREELARAAGRGLAGCGVKGFCPGVSVTGDLTASDELAPTVRAQDSSNVPAALACLTPWDAQAKRVYPTDGAAPTLSSGGGEGMNIQPTVLQPVVAFAQNTRDEVRIQGDGDVSGALSAQPGMKQTTYVAVQTQYGEEVAGTLTARHDSSPCVDRGQSVVAINCRAVSAEDDLSGTLQSKATGGYSLNCQNPVAYEVRTRGTGAGRSDAGNDQAVVAMASTQANAEVAENLCPTLNTIHEQPVVAAGGSCEGLAVTISDGSRWVVRRLTPVECERLQMFPDGHTDLTGCDVDAVAARVADALGCDEAQAAGLRRKVARWSEACPDGPRYRAIGNSMAVNVMRWIGERLAMVDGMAADGTPSVAQVAARAKEKAKPEPRQGTLF